VTNLDDLLQLPRAKGSSHYSKIELTHDLPRRPGVYIFKDRHGRPIYVGKATNLRARVRQYFYGDKRRTIANLMKELDTIEHQVCDTVLEAEVTELRLIHAHRPRYNRKSRPPKASHFVKVTNERFPRLSVVRTLKEDGLGYLGPFRSKKAAHLVVNAIWDAVPIRRCRTRPGSRTGKCAAAQMGLADCPCDGSLDENAYAEVIERLMTALRGEPQHLLTNLSEKMGRLAREQRYEEAAWARDRHDALVRALQNRWEWRSLVSAGWMELEHADGTIAVIDHGTLVETRPAGALPSLSPTGFVDVGTASSVAPSVESAEEATLIWRWMEKNQVRMIECTGTFAYPLQRARRLAVLGEVAA
jgi:DNA polymerase-3 subunit epsilon